MAIIERKADVIKIVGGIGVVGAIIGSTIMGAGAGIQRNSDILEKEGKADEISTGKKLENVGLVVTALSALTALYSISTLCDSGSRVFDVLNVTVEALGSLGIDSFYRQPDGKFIFYDKEKNVISTKAFSDYVVELGKRAANN